MGAKDGAVLLLNTTIQVLIGMIASVQGHEPLIDQNAELVLERVKARQQLTQIKYNQPYLCHLTK